MKIKYDWNNTVNLISSIISYCSKKSDYPELELLTSKELEKYDNVILFLVDWLWYKWLEKYWKDSFLYSKLTWSIQSIFPSTTSTAVTTFPTWYTASEHSIIWWNMYSKECSWLIQILPWKHKISWTNLWEKIDFTRLIEKDNFYKNSSKDIFTITSNWIKNSYFNKFYNKNSKILSYNDLPECFDKLVDSIKYNNNKKYIYSYWWDFDSISHDYWIDSEELENHFKDIDSQFMQLENKLIWTNSLVIVTADHGQTNCENHINIKEEYNEIYNMLTLPLAWEWRCQYCFVKRWFEETFYYEVKEKLWYCLDIYSKEEVLKEKLFWNSKEEKFLERIWDFILLAKDNYVITDWYDNIMIWNHWWISDWEILVPLIKF